MGVLGMKLMFIILVVLTFGCDPTPKGFVDKLCERSKATDDDKTKCAVALDPYRCWTFIREAKCTKWAYYYKEYEMSDTGWVTIRCENTTTLEQRNLCKTKGWNP